MINKVYIYHLQYQGISYHIPLRPRSPTTTTCARGDDGVVRPRDRGPMVRGDHQDHLDELRAVVRQLPAEPQERQHAADADVLPKALRKKDRV